jgi:putative inorganic carbon (HCO3(-)) transporter
MGFAESNWRTDAATAGAAAAAAAIITVIGSYYASTKMVLAFAVLIAIFAVIVWRPVLGVFAAVLLIPATAAKLNFGAGTLSPSIAILFVAGAAYTWQLLTRRITLARPSAAHIAFGVFLIIVVVGLTVAVSKTVLLRLLVIWTLAFVVSVFFSSASRADVRKLLICAAIAAGALGVISLVESQGFQTAGGGLYVAGRAESGFALPDILAQFFVLTVPVAIVMGCSERGLLRIVLLVCAALGAVGIALTLSRGGLIGFAIALVLIAMWQPARKVMGIAILGLLGFGLTGTGPFASSQASTLVARLSTIGSGSGTDPRHFIWHFTPGIIEAHPLIGVGAGQFPFYSIKVPGGTLYEGEPVPHAHNLALQLAAETGILGLTAFLAFLAFLFYAAAKALRARSGEIRPETVAIGVSLVGFLVANFFDYGFTENQIMELLMLYAGALIALQRSRRRESSPVSGAKAPYNLSPSANGRGPIAALGRSAGMANG